jgi:thioredoxin 1
MKKISLAILILSVSLAYSSCSGSGNNNKSSKNADTEESDEEYSDDEEEYSDDDEDYDDDDSNSSSSKPNRNTNVSVIECSDGSFDSQINCGKPFIVDFNATWCGPCQQLRPVLENLQKQYGDDLQIFSVDIDECPNTANRFGIESLPTLMFFKANSRKPVKQTLGYLPANEIIQIVSSTMGVEGVESDGGYANNDYSNNGGGYNNNGGCGNNGGGCGNQKFVREFPPENAQSIFPIKIEFDVKEKGEDGMDIIADYTASSNVSFQIEIMVFDSNGQIMQGDGVGGYADWYGYVVNLRAGERFYAGSWLSYSHFAKFPRGTYNIYIFFVDPQTHKRYCASNAAQFTI